VTWSVQYHAIHANNGLPTFAESLVNKIIHLGQAHVVAAAQAAGQKRNVLLRHEDRRPCGLVQGLVAVQMVKVQVGVQDRLDLRTKALGLAIRAIGASYGGPITVLAGIGTDKRISGVKILENKDTPGLGANASSPHYFVDRDAQLTFYGQYTNKAIQDPFELKNDVAAITASTITSNAVNKLVKVSSQAAGNWLDKNTGGAQ